MNRQSLGGKATAIILRKQALSNYYKNPCYCKKCGELIHPKEDQKVCEVKKKLFCNRSCSALYNNFKRRKKPRKEKIKKVKQEKYFNFSERTKGELFGKCKWQSARTMIRSHASYIYKKHEQKEECEICKYNKHFEICHIKAVSRFDEHAKMKEINSIDNLIGLCPNHHWEFDNGLLQLNQNKVCQ